MAKCTECGAAVTDESKFCKFCGAKLNVVSEHLGTQILGNTQVIMAALERIAPGAAQQYAVLGSISGGPMAGGLVLSCPCDDAADQIFWSTGERLTAVDAKHVVNAWEGGAFHWNPGLCNTCPTCLGVFHRSRAWTISTPRYPHHRRKGVTEWFGSLPAPAAWAILRPAQTLACPFCSARTLEAIDLMSKVAESFPEARSAFTDACTRLKGMAPKGLLLSPKYRRSREDYEKHIREHREQLATLEALEDDALSIVERDLQTLRDLANELHGTSCEPMDDLNAWLDYQMTFMNSSVCLELHIERHLAHAFLYLPLAMRSRRQLGWTEVLTWDESQGRWEA